MRKSMIGKPCLGWFLLLTTTTGSATAVLQVRLDEWALNVNGDIIDNQGDLPSFIDPAAFDFNTGLGLLTVEFKPQVTAPYYLAAFLDLEIDEAENTFFNETGDAVGVPAMGQSWEIDEPGLIRGDIVANLENRALDNAIGQSIGGQTTFPDDVSFALGWDFTLPTPADYAVASFMVSLTPPPAGEFHLVHHDPDSNASVFFSSSLEIIPEPASLALLLFGAMALLRAGRRC